MGKERSSSWYDAAFAASSLYAAPYNEIQVYLPLWSASAALISYLNIKSILDIGCGMGHFAALMYDRHPEVRYCGMDFSEYAVEYCKDMYDEMEFYLSDAVVDEINPDFEAYVCQEMLEHITQDVQVIEKIPKGKLLVFSLPRFDADGHVRWFPKSADVISRYEHLFKGLTVSPIGCQHFLCSGYRL